MSIALGLILTAIIGAQIAAVVLLAEMVRRGDLIVFDSAVDLSSVLLAASAVILTGTAVIVALLSWVGYRTIRRAAINGAIEAALPKSIEAAEVVARSVAYATSARAKIEPIEDDENQALIDSVNIGNNENNDAKGEL